MSSILPLGHYGYAYQGYMADNLDSVVTITLILMETRVILSTDDLPLHTGNSGGVQSEHARDRRGLLLVMGLASTTHSHPFCHIETLVPSQACTSWTRFDNPRHSDA